MVEIRDSNGRRVYSGPDSTLVRDFDQSTIELDKYSTSVFTQERRCDSTIISMCLHTNKANYTMLKVSVLQVTSLLNYLATHIWAATCGVIVL